MKIAIFVPNRHHFGNMITQIPFIQAVKKQHENAQIVIYSKVENKSFWLSTGLVDEVVYYKKSSIIQLVSMLNAHDLDAIYNIYSGSEKVHLAIKLCKTTQTFGHSCRKHHRYCYLNHMVIKKGQQYVANSHLKLINSIYSESYSANILKELSRFSTKNPSELTLLPGGGAGDFKRWSIDNYLLTAQHLTADKERFDKVNIILGSEERDYINLIPSNINGINIEIHMMPSILDMLTLSQKTKLAIANDCGPAHVFQMSDCPIVTLWGWKNEQSPPYSTMCEWLYSHEYSIPLASTESNKKINTISVEKVTQTSMALLSSYAMSI